MLQVLLCPCQRVRDCYWKGGRGFVVCDGAPGVDVTCRRLHKHYRSRSECVLRMPERGTALSSAALRAYSSLCLGPHNDTGLVTFQA